MKQKEQEINYEPFGKQWEAEITKLPKKVIVEMFAKKVKHSEDLKDQVSDLVAQIKRLRETTKIK